MAYVTGKDPLQMTWVSFRKLADSMPRILRDIRGEAYTPADELRDRIEGKLPSPPNAPKKSYRRKK